jgi:PAS domain S-box-containing protein
MSASFPLRANLPGHPSAEADGRDGVARLSEEIAALRQENEHLRRALADKLVGHPAPADSPVSQGLPVQFDWANAGAQVDPSGAAQASLLSALSSVFQIGIFRTDAGGLLTEVDGNLQRILGLDLPSFSNFGWLAAVHPDDRQRAQDGWFEYALQPSSQSMEIRLLRADGQTRHVLMRNAPRFSPTGEFAGQLGFVQDITELRALEAEARLKEELNRQIIASSPDCTKVLDLQGRVQQMTAQGCRLVEVDDFEDVRNSDWSTWWPEEGGPLARAAIQGAARGEGTRFVAFAPTFKGTPKWWDTVINPILNAEGKPVMLLAVSRDITELHLQQEEITALNESLEARVAARTQELANANERIGQTLTEAQLLYNQAPCGYHSLDRDGVYLRINQTELDWLGYQRHEVVGKLHFADRVTPEFQEPIRLRLERLQCGDTPEPFEVDMVRRDGRSLRVLLSCTAVFDDQGRFLQINATAVDISARQAAEQALSAQRSFLQIITDIVPVQLALYDRNLICQFANASYARWLNLPAQRLVGLHLSQVARPENFASAQSHLQSALAGEIQRFEGSRTFPDGNSFYASIEYTPYRIDGEVHGIVIQMVDISQRKAAEDELQQVNQRLRLAFDRAQSLYNRAPCGYHSVDANGVFISINDTELRWLGYAREEVVGKMTPMDFASPRSAALMSRRLAQLIDQQTIEGVEFELQRRDGSTFFALVSSSAVCDDSGRFLETNTTVVDITERKLAERALKANERFMHAIADHVPGLIAYVDTELRFRFANANHQTLYGLDPAAILGQRLCDQMAPDIWAEIAPRLQAALSGEIQRFEAWRPTVHGGPIFVSGTYLPDEHEGEVKGVFIQLVDITERKRVEERVNELNLELEQRIRERSAELLESEQRFRLMVDNIRDYSVFFIDAQGFISDWTDSAQRMDRYSPSDMLGQHYSVLFRHAEGDNAREAAEKMLRLAAAQGQHEVNGWYHRKDGARYWAHSLLISLRDDDGELRGFAKIIRDMSDAKRLEDLTRNINLELEERVAERTEQLLAANKDLESFSYSVSHDLRSPLRHISSFVSLLQEHLGTQPDEVSARYLSTISSSARHMSQLIDGLLAFSRLGRAAVNLAPVDMGELVQAVVAELSHDTGGRVVDWVIAPDLPPVQGDALLLREVWANLLSNAFKYTRLRERARIEIGWRRDNDAHMFYIKDNGVGFDAKYANKLFGVFQRLHRATEFEGTGIGLALTKRIVERHAGEVWAESQANVGSTFSFSIPLDSHPRLFAQHEPT